MSNSIEFVVLVRLRSEGVLKGVFWADATHRASIEVLLKHIQSGIIPQSSKSELVHDFDAQRLNGAIRQLIESRHTDWQVEVVSSEQPNLLAGVLSLNSDRQQAEAFIELLDRGLIRAAEKIDEAWQPQRYVIDGILDYFRAMPNQRQQDLWWDKIPLKTIGLTDDQLQEAGVRYAPGCMVRKGAYIGSGTVLMNLSFVNIGAHIAGGGVMIDGGARIASCAQIGSGVKFGAGSGVEGILEPPGRLPSIVEDNAVIGAMCEVCGIVGEGAIVASGVVMASGKKIYDAETGQIVSPQRIEVGEEVFLVPTIPPYRLAVEGGLPANDGRSYTAAVILKPGDLRETKTREAFRKQGILYS